MYSAIRVRIRLVQNSFAGSAIGTVRQEKILMSPDTELAKYSLQNYIYWVHGFERYFAGMEKKEEKNVRFYDLKPIAVIEPVLLIRNLLAKDICRSFILLPWC